MITNKYFVRHHSDNHILICTISCFSLILTGSTATETPAQKQARQEAELKMKAGAFWRFWSWSSRPMPWQQNAPSNPENNAENYEWPWKGLFGRSSTSELLSILILEAEQSKVELITRT